MILRTALTLSCLLASQAFAITVYKYRDANGVVSFTDQPTAGAQVMFYQDAFEEKLDDQVRLVKQVVGDSQELYLRNDLPAPVEVELSFRDRLNVAGLPADTVRQVVPARTSVKVATAQAAGPGEWHFDHGLRYALSDPGMHGGDQRYALPWAGGPYRISQGPNGEYSHQDVLSRYAVDVAMPPGTPILAARAGVVVVAEDRNGEHGGGKNGNFVRLLHDDGSMSVYLHLLQGSAKVRPGDRVNTGQPIAASGNSGSSSTGPHLHFVVQRNQGMRVASVPFQFMVAGGVAIAPVAGQRLGGTQVADAGQPGDYRVLAAGSSAQTR